MIGFLGVGIHMMMVDDGRISFRFRVRDLRRPWRSGSRFFWKDAIAIDRPDHGGSSWSLGGANLRMSVVRIGLGGMDKDLGAVDFGRGGGGLVGTDWHVVIAMSFWSS